MVGKLRQENGYSKKLVVLRAIEEDEANEEKEELAEMIACGQIKGRKKGNKDSPVELSEDESDDEDEDPKPQGRIVSVVRKNQSSQARAEKDIHESPMEPDEDDDDEEEEEHAQVTKHKKSRSKFRQDSDEDDEEAESSDTIVETTSISSKGFKGLESGVKASDKHETAIVGTTGTSSATGSTINDVTIAADHPGRKKTTADEKDVKMHKRPAEEACNEEENPKIKRARLATYEPEEKASVKSMIEDENKSDVVSNFVAETESIPAEYAHEPYKEYGQGSESEDDHFPDTGSKSNGELTEEHDEEHGEEAGEEHDEEADEELDEELDEEHDEELDEEHEPHGRAASESEEPADADSASVSNEFEDSELERIAQHDHESDEDYQGD